MQLRLALLAPNLSALKTRVFLEVLVVLALQVDRHGGLWRRLVFSQIKKKNLESWTQNGGKATSLP